MKLCCEILNILFVDMQGRLIQPLKLLRGESYYKQLLKRLNIVFAVTSNLQSSIYDRTLNMLIEGSDKVYKNKLHNIQGY